MDAELRLIASAAIIGDSSQLAASARLAHYPDEDNFYDRCSLDAATVLRLQSALEQGGAVFIDEDERAGAGVRLKFNRGDVRAIRRLEGEGGPTGEDDVC
jgi:hypothetical protein